jgi:hypothetical protein
MSLSLGAMAITTTIIAADSEKQQEFAHMKQIHKMKKSAS